MTGRSMTVVVVTYRSADVIAECLAFVADLDDADDVDVVVIDNASPDETLTAIPRHPRIRVIEGDENTGFARAVNRAVATVAANRDLLLLNPDAVIHAAGVRELGRERSLRGGIVAPVIVHPGGRLRVASAGRAPTVWRMLTHYSGLSLLPGSVFEGHYLRSSRVRRERVVDWSTGACLLVSRETWDAVGGLSERWFMYAEDVKLGVDATRAGHPVTVLPRVVATHLLGHSAATDGPVDASWVLALYDYYCTDLARSRFGRWAWRSVVAAGLRSRAIVYSARGRLGGSTAWRAEGRRFRSFARALVAARPGRA
ncbi:glycosyltransferase [Salinibacterium soli]|uniref:Glycosyltransferase family 2 protein n=1 Tax=Antiquaquibacter soli TaxID=3064523 RepID=A0ABT9BJ23_9MICO|nr:glycosyltransferase family 2 protein [Protaetiibacter sp. WY-16]MDO7881024.1 glycosyltransferase family 2 protein [Protaetiibacter sp. WY-16]